MFWVHPSMTGFCGIEIFILFEGKVYKKVWIFPQRIWIFKEVRYLEKEIKPYEKASACKRGFKDLVFYGEDWKDSDKDRFPFDKL